MDHVVMVSQDDSVLFIRYLGSLCRAMQKHLPLTVWTLTTPLQSMYSLTVLFFELGLYNNLARLV
jgi:hypothetical protein